MLQVKLDRSCFKQGKVTPFNVYIVHKISLWSSNQSARFALENSSFGAFKLTKSADRDKYSYSGYYN